MNLKDTYNRIAREWVRDHNKDDWWQEGTNHFLSLLPKGTTVLDVGCGGGIKTRYIAEKGYKVLGTDFSEQMIMLAQEANPAQEFRVLDMYELDSLEKDFDGIFVQAALLHIPKARVMEVLEKMKRRLRNNGLLYIAVKGVKEGLPEEEVKQENDYGYPYERFFSYFSQAELRRFFQELALEVVWEENKLSNHTHWLQIIGRKA